MKNAASGVSTAISACSPGGIESLRERVKDEARISMDIALERNIDAVTAYRLSTTQLIPLVDVRTAQEYHFAGHVPASLNIPAFVWGEWKEHMRSFSLDENPDFLTEFEGRFPDKDEPAIIMCRSGHRSVIAIANLVQAGYTNLYHMWEGFEGLAVRDKDLLHGGTRFADGWKNRGLPYL